MGNEIGSMALLFRLSCLGDALLSHLRVLNVLKQEKEVHARAEAEQRRMGLVLPSYEESVDKLRGTLSTLSVPLPPSAASSQPAPAAPVIGTIFPVQKATHNVLPATHPPKNEPPLLSDNRPPSPPVPSHQPQSSAAISADLPPAEPIGLRQTLPMPAPAQTNASAVSTASGAVRGDAKEYLLSTWERHDAFDYQPPPLFYSASYHRSQAAAPTTSQLPQQPLATAQQQSQQLPPQQRVSATTATNPAALTDSQRFTQLQEYGAFVAMPPRIHVGIPSSEKRDGMLSSTEFATQEPAMSSQEVQTEPATKDAAKQPKKIKVKLVSNANTQTERDESDEEAEASELVSTPVVAATSEQRPAAFSFGSLQDKVGATTQAPTSAREDKENIGTQDKTLKPPESPVVKPVPSADTLALPTAATKRPSSPVSARTKGAVAPLKGSASRPVSAQSSRRGSLASPVRTPGGGRPRPASPTQPRSPGPLKPSLSADDVSSTAGAGGVRVPKLSDPTLLKAQIRARKQKKEADDSMEAFVKKIQSRLLQSEEAMRTPTLQPQVPDPHSPFAAPSNAYSIQLHSPAPPSPSAMSPARLTVQRLAQRGLLTPRRTPVSRSASTKQPATQSRLRVSSHVTREKRASSGYQGALLSPRSSEPTSTTAGAPGTAGPPPPPLNPQESINKMIQLMTQQMMQKTQGVSEDRTRARSSSHLAASSNASPSSTDMMTLMMLLMQQQMQQQQMQQHPYLPALTAHPQLVSSAIPPAPPVLGGSLTPPLFPRDLGSTLSPRLHSAASRTNLFGTQPLASSNIFQQQQQQPRSPLSPRYAQSQPGLSPRHYPSSPLHDPFAPVSQTNISPVRAPASMLDRVQQTLENNAQAELERHIEARQLQQTLQHVQTMQLSSAPSLYQSLPMQSVQLVGSAPAQQGFIPPAPPLIQQTPLVAVTNQSGGFLSSTQQVVVRPVQGSSLSLSSSLKPLQPVMQLRPSSPPQSTVLRAENPQTVLVQQNPAVIAQQPQYSVISTPQMVMTQQQAPSASLQQQQQQQWQQSQQRFQTLTQPKTVLVQQQQPQQSQTFLVQKPATVVTQAPLQPQSGTTLTMMQPQRTNQPSSVIQQAPQTVFMQQRSQSPPKQNILVQQPAQQTILVQSPLGPPPQSSQFVVQARTQSPVLTPAQPRTMVAVQPLPSGYSQLPLQQVGLISSQQVQPMQLVRVGASTSPQLTAMTAAHLQPHPPAQAPSGQQRLSPRALTTTLLQESTGAIPNRPQSPRHLAVSPRGTTSSSSSALQFEDLSSAPGPSANVVTSALFG